MFAFRNTLTEARIPLKMQVDKSAITAGGISGTKFFGALNVIGGVTVTAVFLNGRIAH